MAFKIYTKTGDEGQTGLFGGARLSKADLRIDTYGTFDELNAWIGLVRDCVSDEALIEELDTVQVALFTMGSILATAPGKPWPVPNITNGEVKRLEEAIDLMEKALEPLTNFLMPGGHPIVSYTHLARTVCRRAERCLVALHEIEPQPLVLLHYLNRLSDYLFVLSRRLAADLEVDEVLWQPKKP
jgi:cob(I)alamin adenosyltransferase